MAVPIINPNTGETVGGVGLLFRIDPIQGVVDQFIKDNDDISAMAIYSDNGFIMGSYQRDRIGKMLIDADKTLYGDDLAKAA
jgi:hypothetical protein